MTRKLFDFVCLPFLNYVILFKALFWGIFDHSLLSKQQTRGTCSQDILQIEFRKYFIFQLSNGVEFRQKNEVSRHFAFDFAAVINQDQFKQKHASLLMI